MSKDTSKEVDNLDEVVDDDGQTSGKGSSAKTGDSGGAGGDKGDDASTAAPALDELEAEELEMLTEDESNEAIVVDEAAELRAIRRAEIAMEAGEVDEATDEEFVCTSCFLVKRRSQLAQSRKKICLDCAS